MNEPTKGPWQVYTKLTASENHKGYDIQDVATQHWLATVGPRDQDGIEGAANAHIMAASWALLEALELHMRWIGPPPTGPQFYDSLREDAWKKGTAAIAKARGETK